MYFFFYRIKEVALVLCSYHVSVPHTVLKIGITTCQHHIVICRQQVKREKLKEQKWTMDYKQHLPLAKTHKENMMMSVDLGSVNKHHSWRKGFLLNPIFETRL